MRWQARRTAAQGALDPSTLPTARTQWPRRRSPRKTPMVRAKEAKNIFPCITKPLRLTTCSHCRFRVVRYHITYTYINTLHVIKEHDKYNVNTPFLR